MFEFYNQYATRFRENSAKDGLGYTFRQGLSVIPAAIGHLVDTLLGLDGTILDDKDSHFSGPFGLLLGGIPYIAGYVLGNILQFTFNLPSYIGHYLLDYPVALFVSLLIHCVRWIRASIKDEPVDKYQHLQVELRRLMVELPFTNLFHTLLLSKTEAPNTEMQGVFGFLTGLVPHLSRYFIHRVVGTFTSCIQYFSDGVCDLIRSFYSCVKGLVCRPSVKGQDPEAAPEQGPIRKKARIHLPQDVAKEPSDLSKVLTNEFDLFAIMGIKKEDYELNRAVVRTNYLKLVKVVHPDKEDKKDEPKTDVLSPFEILFLANKILSDPDLSTRYLKYYDSDPKKYSKNPTRFFEQPANVGQPSSAPAGTVLVIKSRRRKEP